MKVKGAENQIADILRVLSSPFRVKLLLALRQGEACVCHLENVLKKRQAYISQHLMALRDSGILVARREGKYIFYRVSNEIVFELLNEAAKLGGFEEELISSSTSLSLLNDCGCPNCFRE